MSRLGCRFELEDVADPFSRGGLVVPRPGFCGVLLTGNEPRPGPVVRLMRTFVPAGAEPPRLLLPPPSPPLPRPDQPDHRPGARFVRGRTIPAGRPRQPSAPEERVRHVLELRPDICSLDMGSLNMGASCS